jgi:hypothetical protein
MRIEQMISTAYGVILTHEEIRALVHVLGGERRVELLEDEDYIHVHDCFNELSNAAVLNGQVNIEIASNDYSDAESQIVIYAPSTLRSFNFMAAKDTALTLEAQSPLWHEQEAMDTIFELVGIAPFPQQVMWSNIY